MKKLAIIFVSIFLLVGVTAGILSVSLGKSDTIVKPSIISPEKDDWAIGNITFKCGNEEMIFELEKNNWEIGDDAVNGVRDRCNQTSTDIKDWNGRTLKNNSFGYYSFNETKLDENTCYNNNATFDTSQNKCVTEEAEL